MGTFLLSTLKDILDGMDAEISIRVTRISKEAAGLIRFLEKRTSEQIKIHFCARQRRIKEIF